MQPPVVTRPAWTSSDLDSLPVNGVRYEIIGGELFASKSPHWHHQAACTNIATELKLWVRATGQGAVAVTPGVLFDEADDVIPDVVLISNERLSVLMDNAGHLTGAPELAIEVLSYGEKQERRDRQFKRKLYATQGVHEYWIVDWRLKQVEVYRRKQADLELVATLLAGDMLMSPLLPEFACPVANFFD
ncbi:MAG: Uma2 family endonuclease [Caldilineaceae bacterium]